MYRWFLLVAAPLLLIAMVAVACGGDDDDGGSTTAPAPAAEPAAAPEPAAQPEPAPEPAAEPEPADDFKVAYLPCGRINDLSWSQAGWEGVEAAEDALGFELALSESVPPADIEAAMRDYASQGFDVILAHCGTFIDAVLNLAPDFPDVWFEAAGLEESPVANVFAYDPQQQEGSFIAGVLAGLTTKTNTLGVVAAFDFAGITRQVEGFRLGARFANPNVEVVDTYINSWEDTAKGKEAALAQIDAGADVIYTATDQAAAGAFEAARENGIYAIAQYFDQSALGPETLLTSVLYQQDQFLIQVITLARDGELEDFAAFLPGLDLGVGDLAPYRQLEAEISAQAKDCVTQIAADIIAGVLVVPGTAALGVVGAAKDIDPASIVPGGTHDCLGAA